MYGKLSKSQRDKLISKEWRQREFRENYQGNLVLKYIANITGPRGRSARPIILTKGKSIIYHHSKKCSACDIPLTKAQMQHFDALAKSILQRDPPSDPDYFKKSRDGAFEYIFRHLLEKLLKDSIETMEFPPENPTMECEPPANHESGVEKPRENTEQMDIGAEPLKVV